MKDTAKTRAKPRRAPSARRVAREAERGLDAARREIEGIGAELESGPDIDKSEKSGEPFTGWDFPLGSEVTCFNALCSYELTGYRPITGDRGLDFSPEPFLVARGEFLRTGHYTSALPGSKAYRDYWHEQYRRCRDGYTVNGWTVTGDHYFFLNFYRLPIVEENVKAGSGRRMDFPSFFVSQYQFFHYAELAHRLHRHIALMKARSIGFSEISAAMAANKYTTVRQSVTMIVCYDKGKLDRTLTKVWNALQFLDMHTDGGMFKLRQLQDTALVKKSGHFDMSKGNRVPSGWQSVIEGVVADDPQKIRGDRVDMMILDEAGSWPSLLKAFVQAQALVEVQGVAFGTIQAGGTGGDKGPALEGLREIYYHPVPYGVLPYRHSHTADGLPVETGYFIPAYTQSMVEGMTDARGWCDEEKNRALLKVKRDRYLSVPQSYNHHCAEYCWTAEEAFALEGENKFNKDLLAEQLAEIRLHRRGPRPERGRIDYMYTGSDHKPENINGFRWTASEEGKVLILEHPVWTDAYERAQRRAVRAAAEEGVELEPRPRYERMDGLYVAGVDGIDIGMNQTSDETRSPSDFCLVIKRRLFGASDPQVVCVYKDRPAEVRTAYKTAMCLLRYYNARANVEATRVGFINWARYTNQMGWLMRRPQATFTGGTRTNVRQWGTPATAAVIQAQNELVAAFVEDYSHTIWFEEALDQLMRYNVANRTKFDIVAAMGMAELADQEMSGRSPALVVTETESFRDFGYWTDEHGYRHWGVIPEGANAPRPKVLYGGGLSLDPYRRETSDTRFATMAS